MPRYLMGHGIPAAHLSRIPLTDCYIASTALAGDPGYAAPGLDTTSGFSRSMGSSRFNGYPQLRTDSYLYEDISEELTMTLISSLSNANHYNGPSSWWQRIPIEDVSTISRSVSCMRIPVTCQCTYCSCRAHQPLMLVDITLPDGYTVCFITIAWKVIPVSHYEVERPGDPLLRPFLDIGEPRSRRRTSVFSRTSRVGFS
jgi:hypothetical protein